MAKVFRDFKSKHTVIEGVGAFIPGLLKVDVSDGRVHILNKSTKKILFDDIWENVQTKDGSVFGDAISLIEYLQEVTEDVILLQVDTNEIQYITRNEAQTDFINS